ncbi:MAG: hypothetical protein K1X57_19625 [Gemmataceae bacterium]|nr:hypothetical protein [Gemmataceae bacterium]
MKSNDGHDKFVRLAGYVDGELNAADRSAAESELTASPEARAALDIQVEMTRTSPLWAKAGIPEPSDAAWARTLNNIHAALEPATPAVNYRTQRSAGRWIGVAVAAAAVVFAALIFFPVGNEGDGRPLVADALTLVGADEVAIVSVQGDDAQAIVVGRPPLAGPLDLATVGDTVLDVIVIEGSDAPLKPVVPGKDPTKPIIVNPADKTTPVVP